MDSIVDDVLLAIFGLLTFYDDRMACRLVCRRWHAQCSMRGVALEGAKLSTNVLFTCAPHAEAMLREGKVWTRLPAIFQSFGGPRRPHIRIGTGRGVSLEVEPLHGAPLFDCGVFFAEPFDAFRVLTACRALKVIFHTADVTLEFHKTTISGRTLAVYVRHGNTPATLHFLESRVIYDSLTAFVQAGFSVASQYVRTTDAAVDTFVDANHWRIARAVLPHLPLFVSHLLNRSALSSWERAAPYVTDGAGILRGQEPILAALWKSRCQGAAKLLIT